MKKATDVERRTNVIPVSFTNRNSRRRSDDTNQVMYPASKNFEADDPLSDVLGDCDIDIDSLDLNLDLSAMEELQELEIEEEPLETKEDFIFHHQKEWDYEVSLNDSPKEMADTIIKQITRLKEDSKRLKYYLDELKID